jgi:RNA polymerase sigma factor (sigma-70 family)
MTKTDHLRQHMDVLYTELQAQLVRIVATNVQAPEGMIEDACQSAWSGLLVHVDALPTGTELGWLATTATREALWLVRRERDQTPLHELAEPISLDAYRAATPEPERALELSERLAEIRRLPVRQQRVVWLQGMGYDYLEIAAVTGESRRTVERQLTRARQRMAHFGSE